MVALRSIGVRAEIGVPDHDARREELDERLVLHVSELAHGVVAVLKPFRPAEGEISSPLTITWSPDGRAARPEVESCTSSSCAAKPEHGPES
jgi:hypothetical protein